MTSNISHAVMSQRHEAKDSLDDFPTPPWATRALMHHVLDYDGGGTVLEPACNKGYMSKVLKEYFSAVVSSDIHDYNFGDVKDLLQYQDPKYAVCCVQHDYSPKDSVKMDGQIQTNYPRKNWSSMMMFNCEHPSVKKLTAETVNSKSGAYLHRMEWAKDNEIGAIPTTWNWLEGWNEPPKDGYPSCVHYTRGGPWFDNWQDVQYATEWHHEARVYRSLNEETV